MPVLAQREAKGVCFWVCICVCVCVCVYIKKSLKIVKHESFSSARSRVAPNMTAYIQDAAIIGKFTRINIFQQ